jgi:uncharacterized membrane protein affecting hemolysin expression
MAIILSMLISLLLVRAAMRKWRRLENNRRVQQTLADFLSKQAAMNQAKLLTYGGHPNN